MAASTRRTNGLCERMALALFLCVLLLHNGVYCQDPDSTTETSALMGDDNTSIDPTVSETREDVTMEPNNPADDSQVTEGSSPLPTSTMSTQEDLRNSLPSTASQGATDGTRASSQTAKASAPSGDDTTNAPGLSMPEVLCVDNEAKDRDAVKLELNSPSNCMETKKILEDNLAELCVENCKLQIYQEENSNIVIVTGQEAGAKFMAEKFNAEEIKQKLGLVGAVPQQGKHQSTVLVSVLLTGLLLAAVLIGIYCRKYHCSNNAKGMRLAEETYPAGEENQGNTLVSVAPLNPPEPQEKPSVNGESSDVEKAQPPPTNGHSTAKAPVADTEL